MTKTRRHHWIFKLWIKIRGLLALLIILAGVAVGLMSLLLPFDGLYKDRLVQFLEQQWQMQVTVGEIDGSWQGYGPRFLLQDLSLQGEQSLQLKSAQIQLNLYQWLIPGGERGIDLSINEAELAMIQTGAQVSIKGRKDEQKLTQTLDRLLQAGALRVQALKLNFLNAQDEPIVSDVTADFLLQQGERQRGLQLLIKEADQQELDIRAVTDRGRQIMKSAQWYVRFEEISLGFLQPFLAVENLPDARINGELWVTTEDGVITNATGQWHWRQSEPDLSFDLTMHYLGDAHNGFNEWQISQVLMNKQRFADFAFQGRWQGDVVDYQSQSIPVPWLSHLVINSLLPNVDDQQRTTLINNSRGVIDRLHFSYDYQQQQLKQLTADFSDAGTAMQDLTVSGLTGQYRFQNRQSHLQIDSRDGALVLPKVFRGAVGWQRLLMQLGYDPVNKQISINQLWCDCSDFRLDANAVVRLDEQPYFQVSSHITDVHVSQLKNYWPHQVWKPDTLAWLDQGLLGGTVSRARLTAAGEILEDTFKNGRAFLQAWAQVDDATVRFNPEWPVVNNVSAAVDISDHSIAINLAQAVTRDIDVQSAQISIPDFSDVEVVADIIARSHDNGLLNYLSLTPVAADLSLQQDIHLQGQQELSLSLRIPIEDGDGFLVAPQGHVRLIHTELQWQDLLLSDINGRIKLDGFTLKPQQLKAQLAGRDTVITGAINTRKAGTGQVDLRLLGDYSILDWFSFNQTPEVMSGISAWQIKLKSNQDQVKLEATSDLLGVSLLLPPPLNKSAETPKKLTVICDIPCDQGSVLINYNHEIMAEISADNQKFSVNRIHFGAEDDSGDKVQISGRIHQLNLDQWLELAKNWQMAETQNAQQKLLATEIEVEQLVFMSRSWSEVNLSLQDEADGLLIHIDSAAVKGRIKVANDLQRRGITVEFDHLHWTTADVESLTESPSDSDIPDIHLVAEEFSFAGVPLGRLRMELRNVADGIKVEQLNIKSPLLELNATGEWLASETGLGVSRFKMVFISEKIADFLQQMDFNPPITNAQTLIEMNVYWPGLPAAFDVATLSGDLRISIGEGEVVDQQPGFGRVLGLFNLTNLPRRLLLDFRDVLSDGLHFEEMTGDFKLNDGVARTDDFLILASAAKIHMQGSVDFVEKSYNQHIIIRPQIGKTFPTLGAIAGGPVGAAAGFLVQGLLGKQLKNANEIKYHVTGPWSEPVIELLEQDNE